MTIRIPKQKIFALGGILFLGLFIWMGSRADGQSKTASIKGYGGRLSLVVQGTLEQMNADLKKARKILCAENNRFCFIDKDEIQHEYSFAFETLWFDDYPVIHNLRSFNFEFRDGAGNLLTLSWGNFCSIETIGYTVHLNSGGEDILASYRVDVSSRHDHPTKENENQVAFAY